MKGLIYYGTCMNRLNFERLGRETRSGKPWIYARFSMLNGITEKALNRF